MDVVFFLLGIHLCLDLLGGDTFVFTLSGSCQAIFQGAGTVPCHCGQCLVALFPPVPANLCHWAFLVHPGQWLWMEAKLWFCIPLFLIANGVSFCLVTSYSFMVFGGRSSDIFVFSYGHSLYYQGVKLHSVF